MPPAIEGHDMVGLMRTIKRTAGGRGLQLIAIVAFGFALAACSKCDVPTWRHDTAPAPQSCHDGPDAK
jgi:hypothetical protein